MVLDWGVRPNRAELPVLPLALAVFFVAFAIMVGSAVWLASSLQLPSFLLLSELSRRQRWLRYLIYGIGGGFLIYLTNSALYLTTETAEFRPAPPRYTALIMDYRFSHYRPELRLQKRRCIGCLQYRF